MTLSTQGGKQPKGISDTAMVFCGISICAALNVVLHIVGAVRRQHDSHGAGTRRPVGAILLLVGWMSLADTFWAVKFLWSYAIETVPGPTCTFLAVLGEFTSMTTVSFNFVIAVDVFLTERDPFRHKSAAMLSRYFLFVALVSVVTTAAFGAADCYGPATDGTCWVDTQKPHGTACESIFFAILLAYITFCVYVLLGFTWRHGCSRHRPHGRQRSPLGAALLTRMVIFTTAFVLLWVPETVFFINAKAGGPSNITEDLGKWQTLIIPLTGTINYVVWRKQLLALSNSPSALGSPRAHHAHRNRAWECSLFALCRRRDGGGPEAADGNGIASPGLELESTEYNPGAPGATGVSGDSEQLKSEDSHDP